MVILGELRFSPGQSTYGTLAQAHTANLGGFSDILASSAAADWPIGLVRTALWRLNYAARQFW